MYTVHPTETVQPTRTLHTGTVHLCSQYTQQEQYTNVYSTTYRNSKLVYTVHPTGTVN